MAKSKIFSTVLLGFVVLSLIVVAIKEFNSSPVEKSNKERQPAAVKTRIAQQVSQIIVYYFHGNVRCTTCRNIEAYTFEAVRSYFAPMLMNKSIMLESINVELPENEHFIHDYELSSRVKD